MASSTVELDETEETILKFIRQRPGRFVGTSEVAEELDVTTNGASYRLKQLRKKGKIDSRQPSRDEIWYVPEMPTDTSSPTTYESGGAQLGILPTLGFGGAILAVVTVLVLAIVNVNLGLLTATAGISALVGAVAGRIHNRGIPT